jgi:hypothetical protein
MEREKFGEIITKLNYDRNKWLMFHEIDNIIMKSGKGFYPDWKHLKFLITDKDAILVQHGNIKPYGARLGKPSMVSGDSKMMYFPLSKDGIMIESSSFYNEWFRQPKIGDVIRSTKGLEVVNGESHISEIKQTINSIVVFLWSPISNWDDRLSFYDPEYLARDRENCIHSSISDGIYMHFTANQSRSKHQGKFFQEIIKFKDIKEINLKVGKEYFNKTYKLE